MKKIYSLLFLLFFFTLQAQIVNIPDPNFKAKLLEASPSNNIAKDVNGNNITIDVNGDNEIQVNEALNVYYLDVSFTFSITNIEGINSFSNLVFLDFSEQNISEVDLSNLINLRILNCTENDLSSINLFALTNLEHFESVNNHLSSVVFSNSGTLNYLDLSSNSFQHINFANLHNLEYLDLSSNFFDSLDLSNLSNLKHLDLFNNGLSSVDLSNLNVLEYLNCESNDLTNIDLGDLHNLKYFNCNYNNLNSLGVSNLIELETLICGSNNLSELYLANNVNLIKLGCDSNNISGLDLSENININFLSCSYNNISDLDLTNNVNLNLLYCDSNNISNLDLSSCLLGQDLSFFENPIQNLNIKNGNNAVSLYNIQNAIPENCYICIDDADKEGFDLSQLPEGVVISTYCSYPPGGVNNTILGYVKYDLNIDGTCDISIENIKLNISDGTETGHTFANNEGEYTFYVPEGNFTLTPEIIENPDYFIISPANANLNFPLLDGSTQTQNFCISPNGNHPDVEIIFSQLVPARPGFEASYRLVYRNKGNQTVSGTISLEYDEDKLDFLNSTVTPDNQSSGLLNYNFSNLNPFEIRTIELSFEVNAPTDTPPVNIGDNLPFSAQIDIGEDENPNDNSFELNQEVVGSFDPNDIACLQGESVAPEMIGEELHYRIRFENTGNFPAERVVVAMPINPEDYEVSSFQLLNTSHEVQARVVDNTAEFFFEEIDLGPNEEGDILFSIKSLESLQIGDSVMSYADIYFDYNYPITTNEAVTTFEIMRTKEVELSSVSIFPNPATTQFMIQSDYKINSVEIYDVAGRLIQVSKLNSNQSSQNISQLPKGMYILKIQTEKGLVSYKLIKK